MFEWDEDKCQSNLSKHGVEFEVVWDFQWHHAYIFPDIRKEYQEDRFIALAYIEKRVFCCVFTIRGHSRRIINLRKAKQTKRRYCFMKRKPLTNKDGEVRSLTKEDFKYAIPMQEFDPEFLVRFEEAKRKRGRPTGRSKKAITLSLDQDLIAHLRETGAGWQSRVNTLLRAAVGLGIHSTDASQ